MLCYGPIRENRQCSSSKQSLSASGTGAEGKVFIGTTSPSLFAAWRNRLQKVGLEECCSASASIALVTQDIPPTRSRKREPTPSSLARESERAAASPYYLLHLSNIAQASLDSSICSTHHTSTCHQRGETSVHLDSANHVSFSIHSDEAFCRVSASTRLHPPPPRGPVLSELT
jgi:hypothetical protein